MEEIKGLIYRIIFPNGKSYIGQTYKPIAQRKKQHKQRAFYKKENGEFANKYPLYNAIRKYGWENLKWDILCECDTLEELNEKEIYWIDFYRTSVLFKDCNGYNVKLGGQTNSVCKFSEKEVEEIVKYFKETGSITKTAQKFNCEYGTIYNIIAGKTYSNFSGIKDKEEVFLKYKNYTQYPKETINKIIELSEQENKTTTQIAEELGVTIRYVQDILSGRTATSYTHRKQITREERQKYNPVNSKHSKETVLNIVKDYYDNKMTVGEISKKYNIDTGRISEIVRGKTWNEVTGLQYKQIRKSCLKKEDVLEIIQLFEEGQTYEQISEKKNTTVRNVKRILSGETWNSVTHIRK